MAVVEVLHKLLDAEKEPQVGVVFTAALIAPSGYLFDKAEITASVQAETDATGTVHLFLTPVSEIEYVGSVYKITWAKQTRYITVPNAGPVNLRDVLTTAPAAGGVVVVPGVAGRSITGQSINGTGNLILTFDQAPFSVDLGVVNPGPAGTGGTVTVPALTTRKSQIIAYKDGVGTTLLKKGQVRFDATDNFDADPTYTTDSSAAWASCTGEATDAALTGWAPTVEATGKFKLLSATRLVVGRGVSVAGNNAEMVFHNVAGGWSVGNLTQNSFGGSFSGLDIKGNNTARNPLYIGWVIGRDFRNLKVSAGGYSAGDTLALRNKSAAIVVEACQNSLFTNVQAQLTSHRGIVFDFGCGGLTFLRTQINDLGSAGSVDARHVVAMQSLPYTDPSLAAVTVYNLPTNIRFVRGYFEGVTLTQTYMVELLECDSIAFDGIRFSCSPRATAMFQAYVSPLATDAVFDGCHHQGNNSSANPSKVVTGIQVMAGAKGTRVTGNHTYSNMAAGWQVEDLADLTIDSPPNFQLASSAQISGAGARRVARSYTVRGATVAGLPTPSVDYLGARGVVSAGPTSTYDQAYVCLRQGGAYQWVRTTSSDLYTVLTHTAGANIIIDSSLSTSLSVVAAGNITLGQTVNNTEGRMTLLAVDPGATARTVSFTTTGTGGFQFTTAVPGPTLAIPASKKALIGWRYSGTTNHLIAFTVDS